MDMELEDEIVALAERIHTNVSYRRRKADRNQFLGVEKPPREKTDASIQRDITCLRQRLSELSYAIKHDNDPTSLMARRR